MNKRNPSKPHKKKVQTIALSVLLAVIVWFMVIYVNDPDITTTISNLNVKFIGEVSLRENQLVLTGRDSIPNLSVTVTGKRSDLISFMDDIYVQVNVRDISEAGEYELTGTISIPTTRITVEKEDYADIPITVEPLVTKEIEVTVKQTGTLKNKVVKSVLTTPAVVITGAESEINTVGGAIAPIDISELETDGTEKVNYLLTDSAGELISDNETIETARSFVEVTNTIYDEKTVTVEPMLTAELEQDYILHTDKTVVTPSSITVGVTADNTDETVIARIDSISDGAEEYTVEEASGMYIPEESKTVKIKTDVGKRVVKELELNVEAENVGEGLTAYIFDTLTAKVWGEDGQLSADSVKATVDASGLTAGTYTLPVKIEGENVGFDGEYTVDVVIGE
ncbi:MAG: hypothetical protein LUF26_01905 [Firmicutes bacterium]|nr:hypothetical protein [Bacillota bacterium]